MTRDFFSGLPELTRFLLQAKIRCQADERRSTVGMACQSIRILFDIFNEPVTMQPDGWMCMVARLSNKMPVQWGNILELAIVRQKREKQVSFHDLMPVCPVPVFTTQIRLQES